MFWEVYANQEIELPDRIDPDDTEAVKEYVKSIWDDIPLPTDGDYVGGSDEADFGSFEILDSKGNSCKHNKK